MDNLSPNKYSPHASRGILFCALAAIFYTGANTAVTELGRLGLHEFWIVGIKESITVLLLAPWCMMRMLHHKESRPDARMWAILLGAGLLTQLFGNVGYVYSLKVIGLAATIPIVFASMLVMTALFGRLLLSEKVTIRSMAAIAMLVVAICFITCGSDRVVRPLLEKSLFPAYRGLAILSSCVTGVCFGLMSIAVRHAMNRNVDKPIVMVIITGVGFFLLVPAALYQEGTELVTETTTVQWSWMISAGIFNLAAFFFLNKGLELTRVIPANITTTSQIAMAAVLGLLMFHEPLSTPLIIGVMLTIIGVLLIGGDEGEIM